MTSYCISFLILEKGLSIYGSSRSTREDFIKVVELFEESPSYLHYLENIIHNFDVRTVDDINKAFEFDLNNYFGKTVLSWNK